MKSIKLLIVFVFLLVTSPTAMAAKNCQEQLATELERSQNQLAQQIREAMVFGRDNKHNYGSNPKLGPLMQTLHELDLEHPGSKQRVLDILNNVDVSSSTVSKTKTDEAEERNLIDELLEYIHYGVLSHGFELANTRWTSFSDPIHGVFGTNSWKYDDGSGPHLIAKPEEPTWGEDGDEFPNRDKFVHHLKGSYFLLARNAGPLQLLKMKKSNNTRPLFVSEIGDFKEANGDVIQNHYLSVRNISDNSFMVFFERTGVSEIWTWNSKGQSERQMVFDADEINEHIKHLTNRKINGFRSRDALQMGDDHVVISYDTGIALWDRVDGSKEAKLLDFRDDDEHERIHNLLYVDDQHFMVFHRGGQLSLWHIYESKKGKSKIKRLSHFGGVYPEDLINTRMDRGHYNHKEHDPTQINAAAIVGPGLLLTAAGDGRLILWKFELDGKNEIVETFPNENPEVDVHFHIEAKDGIIHTQDSTLKFRWQARKGKLLIESQGGKPRRNKAMESILWKPNVYSLEDEL